MASVCTAEEAKYDVTFFKHLNWIYVCSLGKMCCYHNLKLLFNEEIK